MIVRVAQMSPWHEVNRIIPDVDDEAADTPESGARPHIQLSKKFRSRFMLGMQGLGYSLQNVGPNPKRKDIQGLRTDLQVKSDSH